MYDKEAWWTRGHALLIFQVTIASRESGRTAVRTGKSLIKANKG